MNLLIIGLPILSILIVMHELGHFLAAKLGGVGVERFSLGFPPKLWGKKWGETEYVISAIPLGGYVKLTGQEPKEKEEEVVDPEKSFSAKPVPIRMLVVVAGPLFNLLGAVLIFTVVHLSGVPIPIAKVGEVVPDSPAMKAGLKAGDRIVAIEGEQVSEWDQLTKFIHNNPGKSLLLVIQRGEQRFSVRVIPEAQVMKDLMGGETRVGLIGIRQSDRPEDYVYKRYNPVVALYKGFEKTWQVTELTLLSIVRIFQKVIPAHTIGGPIMILQMAGQQAQQGALNLAFFVALLSVSLAVFNLLPVPLLDGWHFFLLSIEGLMGRPVSLGKQEMAQRVGLLLLISLMLFAFYNDLMRIFGGLK
ncbi:MAG: RIP metalloprotease RseP [Candidatus Tectomicrobia bacterium]|uniref:Zinc metalloprotease n=1 Tax=Tectimicrobiota bacterium TaxID=2528274 RepID=A0A932FUZ7_UNCTE|nr:RIP metalloprotease RseP [Candidatus Tectomicrobia bacterium]